MARSALDLIHSVEKKFMKKEIPAFRPGDTVRVHARIVEGQKERIQVFEGVVIRRHYGNNGCATFTVRKVSYNIGVERTFLLHSPRVERIEVVTKGVVRRSRLFYLRPLRGKSTRIKRKYGGRPEETTAAEPGQETAGASEEAAAPAE